MVLSTCKLRLSLEFPSLMSPNAYKIWVAISKTVAGKGLPLREMTTSWLDWLKRTAFAAPSNWLGCGRRQEWRHLTEQHIEGCINRDSAVAYQL